MTDPLRVRKEIPDVDAFANRVSYNEEWYAKCADLYCQEMRRNGLFAREIREKTGKSLRSVAKAMGISAMFLSDLERGNRNWCAAHVEKWRKAIQQPPPALRED